MTEAELRNRLLRDPVPGEQGLHPVLLHRRLEVGAGGLAPSLEREAAELGLLDAVGFVGFVADPAPQLLDAHVLLAPGEALDAREVVERDRILRMRLDELAAHEHRELVADFRSQILGQERVLQDLVTKYGFDPAHPLSSKLSGDDWARLQSAAKAGGVPRNFSLKPAK